MSAAPSTPKVADDIIHETRITLPQFVILAICFVVYVLDGFDIAVISFTAPAMSAEWGISSSQLGIVFSSGVLGMTLGAMFLAPFADVYGRRLVVTLLLLMSGLTTWGVAFTSTVPELIVLRFIAGLGLGALVAALAPLVGEYSPRRHRTLILAITFAAAPLGPVIGGLIAASVIEDHGWRMIFHYAGLVTLIVGALFYIVVPESMAYIIKRKPEGALDRVNKILRYIRQSPIDSLPAVNEQTSNESATVVSLVTPARRARTLLLWMTFFLAFATVYFFTTWTPQVLANAGLPQDQAIRGAVTIAAGSVIGTTLLGWLGRWFPLNRIVAVAFVIGGSATLLLGILLFNMSAIPEVLIWLTLFFIGLTLMGGFTNLYTIALTTYPAQIRSTGLGWAAGLGRGGAVLSPAIAGALVAGGMSMPVLCMVFAVPIVLAAVGAAALKMSELP